MSVNIHDVVSQLQKIQKELPESEDERRQIVAASDELARAAEPPQDGSTRVLYTNLIVPIIAVGVEMNLFEILCREPGREYQPQELAELTNSDPVLLIRVLRFLAAHKIIRQPREGHFVGTPLAAEFVDEGNIGGVKHQLYTTGPIYAALPKFLADTNFRNPTDSSKCAFQPAHNTDLVAFEWFGGRPDLLGNFMKYLPKSRGAREWWDDKALIDSLVEKDYGKESPVFVDIGGSDGHVCAELRKLAPQLKGRVINEDLPHVLDRVPDVPGVEKIGYDFFTPQPIKGSAVYYLRSILHDWPTDRCVTILKNIRPAMAAHSEVWLDEMVVSDAAATTAQVNTDLTMMGGLAGMERTHSQWTELLAGAGFKMTNTHMVDKFRGYGVVVAVPE